MTDSLRDLVDPPRPSPRPVATERRMLVDLSRAVLCRRPLVRPRILKLSIAWPAGRPQEWRIESVSIDGDTFIRESSEPEARQWLLMTRRLVASCGDTSALLSELAQRCDGSMSEKRR